MTEPASAQELFRGRHFDQEIIVLCVRWYLTFKLSSRDLVQMMAERGIGLAHTTILRWVSASAVKNWIAKNGLPPVFSCTSCARGRACSGLAMQAICHEPRDIVEPKGCQHDLTDRRSGIANRLQRPQKRGRGADLVVSIGPDQKQVPHLRVRDQVLEEVERRCIKPLQIVEEQRERMLLPREYAEKAPEDHLEAVLRVLRRQVRDRQLSSDHKLQRRNEVDHKLTVRAQRLAQGVPPPAKLRLALAQKRAHKALEGLGKGGVRDVALVLVELAGREEPTRRDEHLVQLVHHRGLADTGIARHKHELRGAVGHNTVEGSEQRVNLTLSAIKLLRNEQP